MNLDFEGYNANVIEQFAAGLYSQARWIVRLAIFAGVSGTLIVLMFAFAEENEEILVAAIIGGPIVTASAFLSARTIAGMLILKAQTALCQVEIEQNTKTQAQKEQRDDTSRSVAGESSGSESAFCPACGGALKDTAKFCTLCGAAAT
jgi:hypothetical protein